MTQRCTRQSDPVISKARNDEKQAKQPPPLVTPTTGRRNRNEDEDAETTSAAVLPPQARRTLFPEGHNSSVLVTPQPKKRKAIEATLSDPPVKRNLFGRGLVAIEPIPKNVDKVYRIIRRFTGAIGGNGYVGPIYGELTMGSMQKMVKQMMMHTGLNAESRFIDVGSGIGKPNLHVAQYPGVSFSCGVEVENTRYALGMSSLDGVLRAALDPENGILADDERIRGNTVFLHRDIMDARTFDPFTHVYMFSIGFPPVLWEALSDMWNRSQAPWLICYHPPRIIIERYEFDVELLAQLPTSMHGSKEGHTGYIYKRIGDLCPCEFGRADPVFAPAWDLVKNGLPMLQAEIAMENQALMDTKRPTRTRSQMKN